MNSSKRAKEIDDNHEQRERVEAVEQRPYELAHQVSIQNPHKREIRERAAQPRVKSGVGLTQ